MNTPDRKLPNLIAQNRRWQRIIIAFLAVAFLSAGLLIGKLPQNNSQDYANGLLLKVGVVLGLVWLAAPQLERLGWQRIRGSLLIAIVIVLVLWAVRPKIGAIAGAVLIGGSVLFSLIGWFRSIMKRSS